MRDEGLVPLDELYARNKAAEKEARAWFRETYGKPKRRLRMFGLMLRSTHEKVLAEVREEERVLRVGIDERAEKRNRELAGELDVVKIGNGELAARVAELSKALNDANDLVVATREELQAEKMARTGAESKAVQERIAKDEAVARISALAGELDVAGRELDKLREAFPVGVTGCLVHGAGGKWRAEADCDPEDIHWIMQVQAACDTPEEAEEALRRCFVVQGKVERRESKQRKRRGK